MMRFKDRMNRKVQMNKRAQMKIQEMAFVLMGIIIFFAMVALVYFSIRMSSLKTSVAEEREESARDLAWKISTIPEFAWAGCPGCIDIDKCFAFKRMPKYILKLWDVDYLMIEKIYPVSANVECTSANYPDCARITLINKTKEFGITTSAFASLCRYEPSKGGYLKCEIGKIHVAAKQVK